MSITTEYLKIISNAADEEDCCTLTLQFLKSKGEDVHLILHAVDPKPLSIIESENRTVDFWYERLKLLKSGSSEETEKHDDSFSYFFSSLNFKEENVFIFISEKENRIAKNILPFWQTALQLIKVTEKSITQNTKNEYGNYISQLLHDVTSLIDLNISSKKDLLDRIEYQKKLNHNLLFFVRDLDVFITEICIKDLINDSLELIGLKADDLSITLENPGLLINLDVELMAKAFNEIIKNALYDVENNYAMVSVNVYSEKSGSPFLNHDWLTIEINDKGDGIPDDFLPYIKKPFFTTNKQEGFSGFGLSNAEKIIAAHFGKIEVNSRAGTNIKLSIPQLTYD